MGGFRRFVQFNIFLFLVVSLTACGGDNLQSFVAYSKNSQSSSGAGGQTSNFKLSICSELSFENVSWSDKMSDDERNAFALALNITGSFEGSRGWSNLSNNFDGQGMSMGLLNQTLGTGSLQPLLYKLMTTRPDVFARYLSASQVSSLFSMLNTWGKTSKNRLSKLVRDDSLAIIEKVPVSAQASVVVQGKLSKNVALASVDKFNRFDGTQKISLLSQTSVSWAVNTLYNSNGQFKSSWSNALRGLTSDPAYISLQMQAAEKLHNQVQSYQENLDLMDLRSYLVLFDIVVQNGGLYKRNIDEYKAYVLKNKGLSSKDKLLKLIEIRVKESKPQWQADVLKRKRAVALGLGVVHGSSRDFPEEYCFKY